VERVHPLEPMGMAGRKVRALRGLLRGDLGPSRSLLRWVLRAGRFLETYEQVMSLERDAGAMATYFFMSGPYSFRRYGSRGGQGRRLRDLTALVWQHGHRVGLHGCVYSLQRGDYARQREALSAAAGVDVTWHRNHYLVYDAMRSPGLLEAGGLSVDSSCGFHDANGFRAGVAHPYPLWDWQADGPSAVTEVPLVFMDGACGRPVEEEWAEAYERLSAAAEVGGEVAVLFHVDGFVEDPGALERYARLLEWLKSRGADLADDGGLILPPHHHGSRHG